MAFVKVPRQIGRTINVAVRIEKNRSGTPRMVFQPMKMVWSKSLIDTGQNIDVYIDETRGIAKIVRTENGQIVLRGKRMIYVTLDKNLFPLLATAKETKSVYPKTVKTGDGLIEFDIPEEIIQSCEDFCLPDD